MPRYEGRLMRQSIDRTNDFKQAGERYRLHEDWEREDLINNMVGALADAAQVIQDKMIELCTKCDEDWGRRVAEGIQQAKAGAQGATQVNEAKSAQAVEQAEERAHEAQPY
jgi:catalase